MDKKHYDMILQSEFSNFSSWAIWERATSIQDTHNINNLSMFDNNSICEQLNPHYVLVGLNASRSDGDRKDGYNGPWGNFHSDSSYQNDYRLRWALQDTVAWGAYLTDIIKNEATPNSKELMNTLKADPSKEEENISKFQEELGLLGDNDPIIIALGGNAFEILIRNFGGKYRIAKAEHYSNYGKYASSLEQYRENLVTILNRCQ